MTQLQKLAEPFPPGLVKDPPKGKYGSYVPHSAVTERLLAVVGPYSQEVAQVLYDPDGRVEGVVLTLQFEIDGQTVRISESGEWSNPQSKTQGARLKDAISDATKRCAMRAGLGLHLWSQDDYFLDDMLEGDDD